jgi:trimeric autotransporter adhesin
MRYKARGIAVVIVTLFLHVNSFSYQKWQQKDGDDCEMKYKNFYNAVSTLYQKAKNDTAASPDFLNDLKSLLAKFNSESTVPQDGLIAYFPLDGKANDESGKGNNGTISATPTIDRFGKKGGACYFNGSNSLEATIQGLPIDNQPRTLSAFIKIDQNTLSDGYIAGWGGTNPLRNNVAFYLNHYQGKYRPVVVGNDINTNAAIVIGRWVHYLLTFDGSTLAAYIDGELIGKTSAVLSTNLTTFCCGKNTGWDPPTYFKGSIDDVRIYNHALDNKEIQSLFHERGWRR